MMRGDKVKEENKPWSTYRQDMYENEVTYGSNAGFMPVTDMQYPLHTHNVSVTNDNNSRLDLNQLYPEQNPLPDMNTTYTSSSMFNIHGHDFLNPERNLNELPSHSHKIGLSDSFVSDQINNLVDTKEGRNGLNDELASSSGPFSCEIDGNILSLGIGNSSEVRSENGINCNDCTGENHRAIFPHSNRFYDQNALGSSSYPAHQISQNEGLYTNFNNHFRTDYGSDAYPASSQFYPLQKPLPDMLREYPKCSLESPWNFSYGGDTLGANWNHQKYFCNELATSSGLFGCGSTSGLADIGNIFPSSLGLESEKPSVITAKLNRNQFVMPYMPPVESFSSKPSIVCSATKPIGSCTEQENAGKSPALVSATAQAANQKAQYPKREHVQPDGYVEYGETNTLGSSSRKRSANQPPPSAPRAQPKMIDVTFPLTYPPPAAPIPPPVPRDWSTKGQPAPQAQRKRNTVQSPIMPPVPTPRTVPPSIDPKVDFTIPVSPKIHHTNTASPSLIVPPFPNPPTLAPIPLPAHRVELKPMVPSISNPISASFAAPNIPPPPVVRALPSIPSIAEAPHVPDSPTRIKWQDPDEFPPPMGEKCMICKRDLLFTPQGPVSQPAIPPAAAVLPCGHTFHDHCLHVITPHDQSTNPPCIPCAIGEY